jgi:hypothetical protein
MQKREAVSVLQARSLRNTIGRHDQTIRPVAKYDVHSLVRQSSDQSPLRTILGLNTPVAGGINIRQILEESASRRPINQAGQRFQSRFEQIASPSLRWIRQSRTQKR